MKLWLLTRTDRPGWDEFMGFVVRAEDSVAARVLTQGHRYCREARWLDTSQTHCEHIGEGPGEPAVLLDSFNAG